MGETNLLAGQKWRIDCVYELTEKDHGISLHDGTKYR